MPKMVYKFGELFSGPGGMSIGAHNAAAAVEDIILEHAWANDRDADSCATFMKNVPGATEDSVFCEDVRTLDFEKLSAIDGLAFGFPCNDFSIVGESRGLEGKYGPLFEYGVKALSARQPQWFVAENVSGLSSSNQGTALAHILGKLESAGPGYRLTPHLYSFDEYGVPQKRRRIIIVGIRRDLDLRFYPPSPQIYANLDVTSKSALTVPPIESNAENHEFTRQSTRVIERLQHIIPGKNAFNSDLPDHLKLNVRGATISQIYRRLEPEKPSYTVTGSGGGGTHVYHWSEPRSLTNRERARLQTFPDNFVFLGNKESVRRQIGMAVPVDGATAIFKALFQTLLGENYESIESNLSHAWRSTI